MGFRDILLLMGFLVDYPRVYILYIKRINKNNKKKRKYEVRGKSKKLTLLFLKMRSIAPDAFSLLSIFIDLMAFCTVFFIYFFLPHTKLRQ